ncbi:MAG: hypothetical protein J3Q66DRAFT_21691 [Benniella sp.]|nr:MAG: hypothetical protein J3Q66DRAFT_21691 [Benniella sp.]
MSTLVSRSTLRCVPIYLLLLLSICINLLVLGAPPKNPKPTPTYSTTAAPSPSSAPGNATEGANKQYEGRSLDGRQGISIPGAIAGVFMIPSGLVLIFATALPMIPFLGLHKPTSWKKFIVFLIGFYFWANITYIVMVNAGVSNGYAVLFGSAVVGSAIGGLRLLKSHTRPAGETLGPIALHCLGLLILGIRAGGIVASRMAQIGILVGLNVVGFMFNFLPDDHIALSAGTPVLGGYTVMAGADFFARTGFVQQADAFVNSKSDWNSQENVKFRMQISLAAQFAPIGVVAALAGLGLWYQLSKGGNYETPYTIDKGWTVGYFGSASHTEWFLHGVRSLFCCGLGVFHMRADDYRAGPQESEQEKSQSQTP